ncbi:conserved hypothetical protein [Cenarchaeum symbiosum A]|uniref:DUF58 domain-containing protein n=1 Tax=Cenarchaeum symbiosum (strain A) TaxID=414004 RepID=A0RTM6_CENSY|nr:conserved hypothetical protein [Cenarchaeum symbiosum A]
MVRRIEFRTKGLVWGMGSGRYRSRFRGGGTDLAELREYVPGDDTRRIDWNASARHGSIYTRELAEERELAVHVSVDVSGSISCGMAKQERMLEVAASIMYSAEQSGDRIGMSIFTDCIEGFIPPGRGRAHLLRLFGSLARHKPRSSCTDLSASLLGLGSALRGRSLVFVISDFASDPFAEQLGRLSAVHDVILVRVTSSIEAEIPDAGQVIFVDAENNEQMAIDTSDIHFRAEYARLAKERGAELARDARRSGAGLIDVGPTEPFEAAFLRHFGRR